MHDVLVPVVAICATLLGLPWMIMHYLTKWKTGATLTNEDEALLDQMYETARRLEDRLATVERIIAADKPDFRPDPRAAHRFPGDDHDYNRRN